MTTRNDTENDQFHVLGTGEGIPPASPSPDEERESSVALDEQFDHLWKVIVWNDPVNLMSYVVYVLQKLFGYSLEEATTMMLEVHNDGKSIVKVTEREKGERYIANLHSYGLQATMEQN
ncbi:MAG: ATP-dependent Clp protease adapter ClpS [Planctomycetota bacterium]|nr:ATP-dependent Clp protease adapter ClpS [Planctomycetota bacterium]